MTKRRYIHIPEQIIPAHEIYHCRNCENFNINGAAYGDGNTCELDPRNSAFNTVPDEEIPDWCQLTSEETI